MSHRFYLLPGSQSAILLGMSEVHGSYVARARSLRLWVWFSLLAVLSGLQASAQDPTYTLHVYTNLFQIPTLVLDRHMGALPPIDAERFSVSIDNKHPFAPRHVRLEGEDPISLAILMDASGTQDHFLANLPEALASLVPESLHAQDQVYLYAVDCNLVHTLRAMPAEPQHLSQAVKNLLANPTLHTPPDAQTSCRSRPHFYDATIAVINSMKTFPGRRVLLAISDGYDGGSKSDITKVGSFAVDYGVTMFGLNSGTFLFDVGGGRSNFFPLCRRTGGLVMVTDAKEGARALKQFVSLVRGRYILEFQRPGNMTSGSHTISVHINKMDDAIVWPAGTSAPIADPKSDTDLEKEPPAANDGKG